MAVRFLDTMRRRKRLFKPLRGRTVRMYTCGPTVYDYAHIGNFRAFVFEDVLRRFLRLKGYRVIQVMNLTDVDDKTIRGAREAGQPLKAYTEKYAKAFFEDLDALGIERAERYPRATEHIRDMVTLVRLLLKKGVAYVSDGSTYYDISNFKDYGKLSHVRFDQQASSGRVNSDEYSKDEARDFALWKAWDPSDGEVYWETPLGKGRPGWHIECSAMSMNYLGETFDIHAGGEDLIFPHHENEIAQSEAATGKPFVKFWLHNGFVIVNDQRMSKSLGNYYTLRDLLVKGYDPKAIRYMLLSAHYRGQLDFTEENLRNAEKTLDGLHAFVRRVKSAGASSQHNLRLSRATGQARRDFVRQLEDDLNTPKALAVMFRLVKESNRALDLGKVSARNLKEIRGALDFFDRVLGVLEPKEEELPQEILGLIEQREKARRERNWALADSIRSRLQAQGIMLEDTPRGVRWKRVPARQS